MTAGTYVFIGAMIGWLFSLLSPRIIECILNHYKRKALRRSLITEMEEVQYKLALVSHALFAGTGPEIRKFLEWLIPVLQSYRGLYVDDGLAEKVTGFLGLCDSQLALLSEYTNLSRRAISTKKYSLPFLFSQLSNLSLFSLEFQQRTFEIQSQLSMLNQEIDLAWSFNMRTYDSSITGENHRRLCENVEISYNHISKMSRQLVDSMGLLFKCKK